MSGPGSAGPWLAWLAAGVVLVATTRNPLYLLLVLAIAGAVYGSQQGTEPASYAWSLVIKVGLGIALVSVLFNVLTVHAGDQPFAQLPRRVPIIGGPLTFNALLYGLDTALAIAALLLLAAAFNGRVDRLALVRLLPRSLSTAGVAALVALSFFPSTIQTLSEVRQAQAARGFRVRRPADLRVLIVPTLHLSLEHAFDLAETLESRGFGGRALERPAGWLIPAGLSGLAGGGALLALGWPWAGVPLVAAGSAILIRGLGGRHRHAPAPGGDEPREHRARLLLVVSLLSLGLSLATLVVQPESLAWSPYPALAWPALSPAPTAAAALLAAPLAIESLT